MSAPRFAPPFFLVGAVSLAMLAWSAPAGAQAPPAPSQSGAPPADLSQSVSAPTGLEAPEIEAKKKDSTNAAVSAGGQYAAGNSKTVAVTGLGSFDMRRGANAYGASMLGNFAEAFVTPAGGMMGTPAPAGSWQKSVENLQGKLRYDRYFSDDFGAFLQLTGTHDAFQAITFRLNVDPGVKLFFVNEEATKFWGELGYDFEYDLNYTDKYGVEIDPAMDGVLLLDPNGLPYVVNTDMTMHSIRAFVGFQYAFNKEVVLTLGLEGLQGIGGSGDGYPAVPPGYTEAQVDRVKLNLTRTRVNFDAVLTANLGAGFAIGAGFSAKWNSAPLPGKENLDTMSTLTLIYSFTHPDPNAKPAPPPPPSPPPPPPEEKKEPPPPPPPPPTDATTDNP